MRKDRDILSQDIRDIKRDVSLIRELRLEIVDMKNTIKTMTQRIEKLEKQSHNTIKQTDTNSSLCRRLEDDYRQIRNIQEERVTVCSANLGAVSKMVDKAKDSSINKSYANVVCTGSTSGTPAPAIVATSDRDVIDQEPTTSQAQPSTQPAQATKQPWIKVKSRHDKSLKVKNNVQPVKPRALSGFIPRDKRPQLDAVYVSGIISEGDDDDVIRLV